MQTKTSVYMPYNCTYKSPCNFTKQNVPTFEVTESISISIIIIGASAFYNSVTTRLYYHQKLSCALLISKSNRLINKPVLF